MGKKRKKIFFNEEEKEIKIENKEEEQSTIEEEQKENKIEVEPIVEKQPKKVQIRQAKRVFEDSVKVM